MRKIFILLFLIYGHLYALDTRSTLKMYHGIFSALSSKKMISVYTIDHEYKKVFMSSKRIFLAKKPEESDIILITHKSMINKVLKINNAEISSKMPILFVTDYRFLKYSEDIIGAFYWRKGRSQLLFIKKRLEKQGIVLPKAYQNFMIDEL